MKERKFTRECQVTGGGKGGPPPPDEDPDVEGVGNPVYEPNPLPKNTFTPPPEDSGYGSMSSLVVDEGTVDSTGNQVVEGGDFSLLVNNTVSLNTSEHMYSRPSSSRHRGKLHIKIVHRFIHIEIFQARKVSQRKKMKVAVKIQLGKSLVHQFLCFLLTF